MTAATLLPLTDRNHRFPTLAEAEAVLIAQGFKLVPDTCTWRDASGLIDAGVYEAEKIRGNMWSDACCYRIEYAA